MRTYPWTCPFCDRDTTLTSQSLGAFEGGLTIQNARGFRAIHGTFVVCPNSKCREFTLDLVMYDAVIKDDEYGRSTSARTGTPLQTWKLIPSSNAKPFPSYIPQQLLQDYREACLIVSMSPKASATLSRRCLQGMIRDFWHITKANLKLEIEALKSSVEEQTWKAIDAIRTIGNIGAHMEKDVNVIVDVEPDEASKLLWLIEVLFREWYIARHQREQRLNEIAGMVTAKSDAKKPGAKE